MNELNGTHDLIEKCRRGERKAQERLYSLYYKAMYNVSFRLLNNQVEAEDAMQEAFLAAFSKIHAYRGEVSFGSWLKRIVINKAIDVLRSRKMQREEVNKEIENGTDWEYHDEMDEEKTAEAVGMIKEAMKELPHGFRIVLSLFLFEGYDHSEIAQILGISESTSRSQLVRAKKKLIELLNKNKNETDHSIH